MDEEYESCLAEFVKVADAEDDKAYELYATLKSGTQKQLVRLGYVLITVQNIQKTGYEPFKYSAVPSGIPLLPVASKCGAWRTFLRFNLDAWTERYPLIATASDILNADESWRLLEGLHHARIVGKAVYKSPEFGWLGEEKKAVVIRRRYTIDGSDRVRECFESETNRNKRKGYKDFPLAVGEDEVSGKHKDGYGYSCIYYE